MTKLPEKQQRVTDLLSYYIDDVASIEQQKELNALLRNDEELRRVAARWLIDEFLLREEQQATLATKFFQGSGMLPSVSLLNLKASSSDMVMAAPSLPSILKNSRMRFAIGFATCASLVVAAVLLWKAPPDSTTHLAGGKAADSTNSIDKDAQADSGVSDAPTGEDRLSPQHAVLTRAVGVTWNAVAENSPQLRKVNYKEGATLGSERLQFSSGAIQIEFCSGATVVLEGPADFEIVSSTQAICHSGKLRAHAPPQAHGFSIAVPGMDVVDLGTEFAIAVDEEGKCEVHVLDGEVSLRPITSSDNETHQSLFDGESVQFNQVEGLQPVDEGLNSVASREFIGSRKIASLAQAKRNTRLQMWQNQNRKLINDPATIAHYDFKRDESWSRTLINHSPLQNPGLNGAIVGCRWSSGRWPNSQSLDFKGTSDRIRLNIPGEYESLTYMAWVRIDGLDRVKNALVLTDEWQRGEPHWQLSENCELILGISDGYRSERPDGDPFQGPDYVSPRLLGRKDLGRWVFLTTVYDAGSEEVRHYFDGQLQSRHAIKTPHTLRFGATSIGNWTSGVQDYFPVRSFNGRMDELTILARPLSDEEILATFEMSSP